MQEKVRQTNKTGHYFLLFQSSHLVPVVIIQRPVQGLLRQFRKEPFLTIKISPPISASKSLEKQAAVDVLCSQTFQTMQNILS
jgi:hypothetical protein